MTNQTPLTAPELAALREKIVAANPLLQRRHKYIVEDVIGIQGQTYTVRRPIRLADVLLALNVISEKNHGIVFFECTSGGWIRECGDDGYTKDQELWNLRQDSLDLQSPETLRFLHDLLCSK